MKAPARCFRDGNSVVGEDSVAESVHSGDDTATIRRLRPQSCATCRANVGMAAVPPVR